jgi:hypothetical protein
MNIEVAQNGDDKWFVIGDQWKLSICVILIVAIFALDASTPSG